MISAVLERTPVHAEATEFLTHQIAKYTDDAALFAQLVAHYDEDPGALAHQRPSGVSGDWSLIPAEERSWQQKIAASTGGIVTSANIISVASAELARRGIDQAITGIATGSNKQAMKGIGKIVLGRAGDLADGAIATRYGLRGETGALIDSGLDKALATYAIIKMIQADIVSLESGSAILAQQAVIAAENALIKKLGGEPNPLRSGKYGMGLVWSWVVTNLAQEACLQAEKPKAAAVFGRLALAAEASNAVTSAVAITGYGKQIIRLTRSRS